MFIFRAQHSIIIRFGIKLGENFSKILIIVFLYSHTHDSDELVYRKGFMHVFKNNEILARKWNPDENNMSMEGDD